MPVTCLVCVTGSHVEQYKTKMAKQTHLAGNNHVSTALSLLARFLSAPYSPNTFPTPNSNGRGYAYNDSYCKSVQPKCTRVAFEGEAVSECRVRIRVLFRVKLWILLCARV